MKINKYKVFMFFTGTILFGLLFFNIYFDFIKDNTYNKKVLSIEGYNYTLKSSSTKLFKSKFKELKTVLDNDSIDYREYAKLVSELFIIDLFTLDNKLSSTDIGGVEYIYPDLIESFKENIGNTLYKNIENNLDGNRKQELPVVENVIIDNIFETKYIYNDKEYNSYLINASISYDKDLEYQNKIELTIINDNNKLYIVKGE